MNLTTVRRRATTAGAAVAATALISLALPTGSAAAADGDDVDVVNTETVQVYTDASGEVKSQRVYEQLAMMGQGEVEFDNPVGEGDLRNLDGFSGFEVADGVQRVKAEVDGVEQMRSVSDFGGDLPLTVDVEYRFDGEVVEPGDFVGESGEVEVTFTVTNVTGEEQEISYPDGSGGTTTESVEVPLPLVGSLSTTLPASFTEVEADGANMAGDGRGGTTLSYTMTLLAPIGSDTASFGYTAQMRDGVVPDASVTVLPVDPLQNPTFKSAAASYQGGADTGIELTAGAQEIDANLLKIRDGAAELLTGLVQLHEGSQELSAGLQGEAAPGAEELAAGARDLRSGLGQIDDGAGRLAGGAAELSDGTGQATTGAEQLESGLRRISGGLGQLSNRTNGLPSAAAGVEALKDGVDKILAGLGGVQQQDTILFGLNALEMGLEDAETGAGDLLAGLASLRGDAGDEDNPLDGSGIAKARKAVSLIQQGLSGAIESDGSLDQLVDGLNILKTLDCGPACQGVIDTQILPKIDGTDGSRAQLTAAAGGLGLVATGLGDAIAGLDGLLIPGATDLKNGLTQAKDGAIRTKAGVVQLKDGATQVRAGLGRLEKGVASAVSGVLQLSDGADAAVGGAGDLKDGISRLHNGAGQLASGANELATGAGEAHDGSGRLADGAGDLATGLADAADGSGQLEDGLSQAREAAPALPQGAERLSEEGMSQLVEAGKGTAKDYGKLYATVAAGSERAQGGTMAFGAPEDAQGLMAYSFEIQGEDGEAGRNVARGVGALVLGGLGLGAVALRRRLF